MFCLVLLLEVVPVSSSEGSEKLKGKQPVPECVHGRVAARETEAQFSGGTLRDNTEHAVELSTRGTKARVCVLQI